MLKLFFCDDNRAQLSLYTELAQRSILLQDWDIQMGYSAQNSTELLEHLPSGVDTGLYFLDIDLQEKKDGFWLAEEIRRYDPKAFLIFITSHMDRMMDTFLYRLEAMDFISKTQDNAAMKKQIFSCISAAYKRYELLIDPTEQILKLKTGAAVRFISCSRIFYIKVSDIPHQITFFTEDDMFNYTDSLSNIAQRYPSIFLSCSRFLLVNRYHIKHVEMQTRTLTLSNGTTHTFSIRCLTNIRQFLTEQHSLIR